MMPMSDAPQHSTSARPVTTWALLAGAALCAAAFGSPARAAATLTFDEEFTSFVSSPDGSAGWMTSFPGENRSLWSNHDGEWYSDSSEEGPPYNLNNPFSLKNGILTITAQPWNAPYGLPYTSGVITTYKSFSQLYGIFSIRAKLPAGQGLWPAFWLLPASNDYTSEIDVFEVLGQAPSVAYVSTHGADSSGNWSSDVQPIQTVDTSDGFHVFSVNWGPKTTTFSIDGKPVSTQATPASMNTPMFMIVNLGVGGEWSWPGPPDGNTPMPAILQIAWVRAYATNFTKLVSGNQAIVPRLVHKR